MTRVIHKPKSKQGILHNTKEKENPYPRAHKIEGLTINETIKDTEDDVSTVSGIKFLTEGWIEQNIGSEYHFRYMYIAGVEVTYSGRKGYLTVHLSGEHPFEISSKSLTEEELTDFAIKCVYKVLTEQYNIFKTEALKIGVSLEATP